jgi:hypothetical protein
MSGGRKPLEGYCTNYHCAGDCGLRGSGYQHGEVFDFAQQKRKRLTLAAFDALGADARRKTADEAAAVRRKAKDSI